MSERLFSSASFRQSLSSRLKNIAKETKTDLLRIRRKVAFERFLARLFVKKPFPWILKGGYALEVRFDVARATKDLDLSSSLQFIGDKHEKQAILLEKLREYADVQLGDHFLFQIEPSRKFIDAAPQGGFRFPIRCMIAGKLFVSFPLDIGLGDYITSPVDEIVGTDWLDFYGIPPARFEVISLEQQFAEKIHALTLDRGERENSRVKDLVDVVLLIDKGLTQDLLFMCLKNTFQQRDNVAIPLKIPHPPNNWMLPFKRLAEECELQIDFDEAVKKNEYILGYAT